MANDKLMIETKPHNPIVAKAQKTVKRRWVARTGKWIKAHQKTIYLTLEGLGSLALTYWYFKRRLARMSVDFDKKTIAGMRESAKLTKKVSDQLTQSVNVVTDVAKTQAGQKANQQILQGRIQALEATLKDPKFRKYLKDKHGITDLKGIDKLKPSK